MADGGGLIAAFNVYKKKITDEEVVDTKLPGLEDLNGNQLFFVSFAAVSIQKFLYLFLIQIKKYHLVIYMLHELIFFGKLTRKIINEQNTTLNVSYFIQAFCQTATPEYLEKNKDDKHATSQVRINGAVSNSEGFSEAFNCPKTSPLNKDQKCIFWSEK